MRLSIDDTLAERLQQQLKGRRSLDAEVTFRLQETLHAPNTRVTLGLEQLDQLAEMLGTQLPIRSFSQLRDACGAAARG